MSEVSVAEDGKRLAFKQWSGHPALYMADLERNGTRIRNYRHFRMNRLRPLSKAASASTQEKEKALLGGIIAKLNELFGQRHDTGRLAGVRDREYQQQADGIAVCCGASD
jgi:hypothetical protein